MPSHYQLAEDLNAHPLRFRDVDHSRQQFSLKPPNVDVGSGLKGGSASLIATLLKGLASSLAKHPSDRLSRFIGRLLGGGGRDWIEKATRHRGALKSEAKLHGFSKVTPFSKAVIKSPASYSRGTLKRAHLALTLARLRKRGGEIHPGEAAHGYELKAPSREQESSGRFKVFLEGIPDHAPPSVRKFIEVYGDAVIVKAKMCRVPIKQQAIIKLGNILTLGNLNRKLAELKKVFGSKYDEVFHLYVVVQIRTPDGRILDYKIEKNEKVEVHLTKYDSQLDFRGDKAAEISQPPTKTVTILEMFKRAERGAGGETLWRYNLAGTNCQAFTIALLGHGNGMLTDAGFDFARQDVDYLLPDWLARLAKHGTDLGNRIKSFLFGKGLVSQRGVKA